MRDFEFEVVIGLEVHAELSTATKIFCACTTAFGREPNSQVCPGCLGMPGTLPVLNKKVVAYAIRAGLALNCRIAEFSTFDRKHYFYPDLGKAYQISQYNQPVAVNGWVEIAAGDQVKRIGVHHLHMEEDAGKLVHGGANLATADYSLADYNRSGMALIEIVSEPDMRSVAEAVAYLETLKAILEYTEVSDCRMEQGRLRCDANVSLRPWGQTELGIRTEVKNMNSFKSLQRALEYEVGRHAEILREGGTVVRETRGWDDERGITVSQRGKEEAHDYRYFPDPDLVPLVIPREWVAEIQAGLPELPVARKARLMADYDLPAYDAGLITGTKAMADYFDAACRAAGLSAAGCPPEGKIREQAKQIANFMIGELTRLLNEAEKSFTMSPVSPEKLVELINLQAAGTISHKIAKTVFEEMFATGQSAKEIVAAKGLVQISDVAAISAVVREVVAANPNVVADFKAGKEKAIGFLVGQVMKVTKGKANPGLVNELLREEMDRM